MFMDFSQIVLSGGEKKILRESRSTKVKLDDNHPLVRHGFVNEVTSHNPGGFPTGTGFYRISHRGEDYIKYRRDLLRARFWLPVSVSIITTLLLNGIIRLWPQMLTLIQGIFQ